MAFNTGLTGIGAPQRVSNVQGTPQGPAQILAGLINQNNIVGQQGQANPVPGQVQIPGGFNAGGQPPLSGGALPPSPGPFQPALGAPSNIPTTFAGGGPAVTGALPAGAPPTGLTGFEQALRGGTQAALGTLGSGLGAGQREIDIGLATARGDIGQGLTTAQGAIGQGLQAATGAIQAGAQGQQRQSALAGLLGPAAQQQAFNQFTESPGQAFLTEQAERSLLRNQAATGGLGGGNVLQELQRQAIGLAQQDFSNQFQRGQQALGSQQLTGQQQALLETGAAGQQAGLATGAGGQLAGLATGAAGNLSNLFAQGGVLGSQLISGAAGDIGGARFTTGQQLAQAAGGTTSALANLQNQLGLGQANVLGQTGTNLANLVSGTGQASSQLQQQLATILANIGVGGASAAASPLSLAGQFDAAGILGQNTAVQNALGQLIQLNQGGGTQQQNTFNTFGGSQTPSTQPVQSGTFFSGTGGQQVA